MAPIGTARGGDQSGVPISQLSQLPYFTDMTTSKKKLREYSRRGYQKYIKTEKGLAYRKRQFKTKRLKNEEKGKPGEVYCFRPVSGGIKIGRAVKSSAEHRIKYYIGHNSCAEIVFIKPVSNTTIAENRLKTFCRESPHFQQYAFGFEWFKTDLRSQEIREMFEVVLK